MEVAGAELLEEQWLLTDTDSGEGTSWRSGTIYSNIYLRTGHLAHDLLICETCTLIAPREELNLQIYSTTIW